MVVVGSERSVAGEVLLRNGHMERECLKRDSMVVMMFDEQLFQLLEYEPNLEMLMLIREIERQRGDAKAPCRKRKTSTSSPRRRW